MKPSSTDTQQVERDIEAGNATSQEQASDLAALEVAAGGQVLAGQPVEPEKEEGPDLAAEIAGLVKMAVGVLSPMFPSLPTIYTDETTDLAAGAVAKVCDKYGWMQDGMMGKYGEEIACAIIIGPLAFATVKGVKHDLADIARRKPDAAVSATGIDLAAPPAAPAPAESKQVTFGGVVGPA
ncbi:hypothetical protein [Hydrogenophaga sp.]|uniref:hypothetical protein n=1 Tax=Hydrogenophaga sp. TaxID=1904254 RepID=UPI003D13A2A8